MARVTRISPWAVSRIETIKLASQLPLQLLVALVLAGPVLFAGVLSGQAGSPSDALMGNWSHTSGFALSLVLLSFAGNWGAPVVAGILAGDVFASEDRHRTWKTILGGRASLGQIVTGKLLAVGLTGLVLGLFLALGSLLGGVIFVGAHPMVDLSGRMLSAGHLLVLTLLAWLLSLPGLLAFVAVAAFASAASRNVIVGVLAPVLVGLCDQVLALTGNGAWFHLVLPSSAFTAWPGTFSGHLFLGPAIVSELACVAWIALAVAGTWRILSRREFMPAPAPDDRVAPVRRLLVPGRIVIATGATLAVAVALTTVGPAGVTNRRLAASLAATFRSLTVLQQNELGHPIPAGSKYTILPLCNKRGLRPVGPGDWDCTVGVYVLLPGGSQPLTDTPVDYDVSIASDGCYKAAAPAFIVGGPTISERGTHHRAINPLNVIYGCFNVL